MILIGVIVNTEKDKDLTYTKILLGSILKNNAKYILEKSIAQKLGEAFEYSDENEVVNKSEMIICLGGDGTFLSTARKVLNKSIPILGINLGHLGFLTEIDKEGINKAIASIVNGNYEITTRMMIENKIIRNGNVITTDIALNDIVISRGGLSRILHLNMYINDIFMDSFSGDGIIMSSPTGSTGYSLSAGGPIVEPDIDLIIATPICPHKLSSRSVIVTCKSYIKIVIDESFDNTAMLTLDGQVGSEIRGGDIIEIRKSKKSIKILTLNSMNFFEKLRSKIYNGGENV